MLKLVDVETRTDLVVLDIDQYKSSEVKEIIDKFGKKLR